MVVETGIAIGEAMITTKADMGWTQVMVMAVIKAMETVEAAVAAHMTPTTTTAVGVAAVEVTVNITVNNIKILEVINIKLI